MGFISRFKYQRALPRLTNALTPGFTLYSFPAMRRLATLVGTTNLVGPNNDILTLFIPANWWADGHEVIWRFYFTWNDGFVPAPPGLTITEQVSSLPAAGPSGFLTPTPPAAVGTVQCCISRRMIRQGSQVLFYDDEFAGGQYGISGVIQGTQGIVLAAPAGGWDFSLEIQFLWKVVAAGLPWPVQITVDNAIALIAPPLNLRA